MQQTLNAGQDSCNVVGGTPSILQNVEAQLAICIDIGMKHSREEFDGGGFIGVTFVECKSELERPILEWCVS